MCPPETRSERIRAAGRRRGGPVLPSPRELAVDQAADNYDRPRHLTAGRSDLLPVALLGCPPVAAPDDSVAGNKQIGQSVGRVRKSGEEACHRKAGVA